MSYKKPGAYVERIHSVSLVSNLPSTSVVGFVGDTIRGVANKPVKVTSWSQFEQKFAKGIANPFEYGGVADAVYGFFTNGGTELYIVRTVEAGSKKATATIPESGVKFEAKEEGTWGNDLTITVRQDSKAKNSTFTVVVNYQGTKVEELKGLNSNNFAEVINETSEFIQVAEENKNALANGTGDLTGGTLAKTTLGTYKEGLECFESVRDINILAIPNVNDTGVQEALVDYCAVKGNLFPIVDVPANLEIEEVMDYKDRFGSFLGAMYYPRVQIVDPVTSKTRVVSPTGYLAGLYAYTDTTRGVHKSPAGVEASLKGVIGVEKELPDVEIGNLNNYNINCIIPKSGRGIVVWGARMLQPSGDRQFVSDIRLDIYVEESIKRLTEWAVFEPIDEQLFNRMEGQLCEFFNGLMDEGSIKGTKPEEAYFVVCDETINDNPNSSTLEIEVGYAKKKPAEFIVTRISQMREV